MIKYIFIALVVFLFANDNPRFADRHFIDYGRIDASIESKDNINNLN